MSLKSVQARTATSLEDMRARVRAKEEKDKCDFEATVESCIPPLPTWTEEDKEFWMANVLAKIQKEAEQGRSHLWVNMLEGRYDKIYEENVKEIPARIVPGTIRFRVRESNHTDKDAYANVAVPFHVRESEFPETIPGMYLWKRDIAMRTHGKDSMVIASVSSVTKKQELEIKAVFMEYWRRHSDIPFHREFGYDSIHFDWSPPAEETEKKRQKKE